MKNYLPYIILTICVGLAVPVVYGEDPNSSTDGWEFKLMPYAWLPSTLKSKSTLSGASGTVKLDLQDILDNLDMLMFARVEAWKDDKWGLSYDSVYLNLGYDDGFKGSHGVANFKLDIDIRLWMNDFAVHYRLVDERFGEGDQQRFIFEKNT